jgi:hypothetical protein
MPGVFGFWAGRDLYRATLALTQELDFCGGLIKDCPHLRAYYNKEKRTGISFIGTDLLKTRDTYVW